MRSNPNRTNRFVFGAGVDDYIVGRPEWPSEPVRDGAHAVGVAAGARVLEIGAGTGQLTGTLVAEGLDVVALEPDEALRARAASRLPAVQFVADTFESFRADERFDAIFSANSFHWLDPAVSYPKAAAVAKAVVLLWDVLFISDAAIYRRAHVEVVAARGGAAPEDAAAVRADFEEDAAGGRDELAATGAFGEPWWRFYERTLEYTQDRYVSFIRTMGAVAAQPEPARAALSEALRAALPTDPFDVTELIYVVAARAEPG